MSVRKKLLLGVATGAILAMLGQLSPAAAQAPSNVRWAKVLAIRVAGLLER